MAARATRRALVRLRLGSFARAGAVMYCAQAYGCEAHQSIGFSMWPTFNPQGDVFLTAKPWAASRAVSPGEVVLARSPSDPRNLIVKRVLATEGQQVRVDYGDNAGLRGAHSAAGFEDGAVVVVPKGHVWLLGDNVDHSNDSRAYGPVPRSLLRGRVVARIWPPLEAGWVHAHPMHQEFVVGRGDGGGDCCDAGE